MAKGKGFKEGNIGNRISALVEAHRGGADSYSGRERTKQIKQE